MRTQQKRRRSPWLLISVVTAALALSLALVAQAKVSAAPGSRLPKDKQALWDRQEKERKDAQAAPSPPRNIDKPPRAVSGPPGPPPKRSPYSSRAAGAGTIVESELASLPSSLYGIANHWVEEKGGNKIIVYAGVELQDRAQGVLVVRELTSPSQTGSVSSYQTPVKAGEVRIAGADGERLIVTSTTGRTFVFDVGTRTFVSP